MEYKCSCGATSTLNDQEAASEDFRCPHCGMSQKLTQTENPNPHPKPWIAALLTVLSPGLGHLYSGNIKFAIALFGSALIFSNLLWLMIVYWDGSPYNVLIPMVLSLGFFVFTIVTAVKMAKDYHTLPEKPQRSYKFAVYAAFTVGSWIVSYLAVPIFGSYGTYTTPTSSMQNTIMVGDRILCDESVYDNSDPERGDLVLFRFPTNETTLYVKRCIAIGGDVVQMTAKKVFVNGQEIPLPPTGAHSDSQVDSRRDNFGPYQVPAGNYFMLGDNRDDSFDSRFGGAVTRSLIEGRAVRVWFNFRLGRIGIPLK